MATTTTNLGLVKPGYNDAADIMDINNNMDTLDETVEKLREGIAIIVDGDTASVAVPAGGYAYIKNNTHGLVEGMYKNKSSNPFPVAGGTANSTVFTAAQNGAINDAVASLNSKTIKKMDFTATTSANGNAPLMEVIDTTKYTVISVSAHKTATPNDIVICIPYQYTAGRPGRINAVHCIGETNTYEVIANTSITGVLFYAEI